MTTPPSPAEIFHEAASEGRRRLDQTGLELLATGFVAGFTIVFGIVAMGLVHSALLAEGREWAKLAGAMAFGLGLVLLVVQRAELFSENFFDPIAAMVDDRSARLGARVARLWLLTLVSNLVGGAVVAAAVAVDGVLPAGAADSLARIAREIAARDHLAAFLSAVLGGVLVASLSYALAGTGRVTARILVAWLVGFLLAAGPFDHVVVTLLHLGLGVLEGAPLGASEILGIAAVVTAGNLVGGVGLVTLSHVAQARGGAR